MSTFQISLFSHVNCSTKSKFKSYQLARIEESNFYQILEFSFLKSSLTNNFFGLKLQLYANETGCKLDLNKKYRYSKYRIAFFEFEYNIIEKGGRSTSKQKAYYRLHVWKIDDFKTTNNEEVRDFDTNLN